MRTSFKLNSYWLSTVFWEILFESCYEDLAAALPAILANYKRCEAFRSKSDYNTGSISVACGVCLYALCRHFRVGRAAEIGTFIGKSTTSMALAVGENGPGGVIHTCDKDNACFEPWQGLGCAVRPFPKTNSTNMLTELLRAPEKIDLFHFDGRIQPADLPLIAELSHPGTLYVFDDFVGTEKGVANVLALRQSLRSHILIEPCGTGTLRHYGVQDHSFSALLFNTANLMLTNQ